MPDMASAVTWIPGIHGLDPRQNSMVAWIPDMGLADLQKNRFQPYSGQNSFKLPYAGRCKESATSFLQLYFICNKDLELTHLAN